MIPVRILEGVGGADFSWAPGQIVEMSEEDAAKWADGYRGELVNAEPPAPEKAADRSRGGGRGEQAETADDAPARQRPRPSRATKNTKEAT